MKKYPIKIQRKDFQVLEADYNVKGSRMKKIVIDHHKRKAFFKYEGTDYNVSEACSEKMCYEIAKILGYNCAKIELAKDENGTLGILNYLFVDIRDKEHIDAVSILNIHDDERSKYYTISNIKKMLDQKDKNLFKGFIKIMIFDALVGEQDRHEENWGIEKKNETYQISPLYDNGCNLLREFRNEEYAQKFYCGEKDFDAYIKRSKTILYKEDNQTQYKHFELIEYLNNLYPNIVQEELNTLKRLTDEKINIIVNKIPDELLTNIHKKYIIDYLRKRRDILTNIK